MKFILSLILVWTCTIVNVQAHEKCKGMGDKAEVGYKCIGKNGHVFEALPIFNVNGYEIKRWRDVTSRISWALMPDRIKASWPERGSNTIDYVIERAKRACKSQDAHIPTLDDAQDAYNSGILKQLVGGGILNLVLDPYGRSFAFSLEHSPSSLHAFGVQDGWITFSLDVRCVWYDDK